jgi:hypothetical protein
VGEFGAAFNGPAEEYSSRLQALDDEIGVFEQHGVHWTTWTYKDIGVMGWVTVDPESEYLQVIRPLLDAKLELATDLWGRWLPPTPARAAVRQLGEIVAGVLGAEADPQAVHNVLEAAILPDRVGAMLQPLYARCFRGMSEADLDRVLSSFDLRKCRVNQELGSTLRKYLQSTAAAR